MAQEPIKILLIEDNADHRELIKNKLLSSEKEYKYIIDEAVSGEEGLDKAVRNTYNIILLDYTLPKLDGLAVLNKISAGIDTPVIMITGMGNEQISVEAMKKGAYDYIIKSQLDNIPIGKIIERSLEKYKLIIERKKAEEELKYSEERFRAIINDIPDIVYKIDYDGIFTFLNRAIRLLGYEPEELIGKHYSEILHPDDYFAVSREYVLPKYKGKTTGDEESPKLFDERRTGERGTTDLLVRLVAKNYKMRDGEKEIFGELIKLGEINAVGMYEWNGQNKKKFVGSMGTIGIIRDVSKRIALEGKWKKYEFIVNASREHMTLINKNYVYEAVNDSYCRAFKMKRNEIVGKTVEEIWGKETFFNIIKVYLDKCFSGEELSGQEWFKFGKLGVRCSNVSYYPYYNEDNLITHAVVVSKDITDQKSIEKKLNEYTKHIEKDLEEKRESIRNAQLVQKNLNTQILPNINDINISALYMPSEELGGDIFEIKLIDNKLIIILADCTGHGIEAAMDASLLKAISDRHFWLLSDMNDPGKYLEKMNQGIISYLYQEKYFIMFACIIDIKTKNVCYANANHRLPYIIRKGIVKQFDNPEGFHLGFSDSTKFRKERFKLKKGDILFFYSDAIVEIRNKKNFFLNKELENTIKTFGKGLNNDLNHLINTIKKANKKLPLNDDTTLILIENISPIKKTFKIRSIEEIDGVSRKIKDDLEYLCYSKQEISQTAVAFIELLANAIEHGNKNNNKKSAIINLSIDCERAEISIEDEGEGFNPKNIPIPTNEDKIAKLFNKNKTDILMRGRGIWMARHYTDSLSYNEKGNKAVIIKKREPIKTIFDYFNEDKKDNTSALAVKDKEIIWESSVSVNQIKNSKAPINIRIKNDYFLGSLDIQNLLKIIKYCSINKKQVNFKAENKLTAGMINKLNIDKLNCIKILSINQGGNKNEQKKYKE